MAFNEELFWHKKREFNREMVNLSRRTTRKFKTNIASLMPGGSGALADQIKSRTKKRHGEIIRMGWSTFRYGFIREQGFNKATKPFSRRPPNSGPAAAKTVQVKSHQRQMAPRPWIRDTMDTTVTEAADITARIKGDDMVAAFDKANEGFIGKTKFRA